MNTAPLEIVGGEGFHRFAHRAMATIFEIFVGDDDRTFASQAAHAVFEEIDILEQELSRYRANSDIARINNLAPGASTTVGIDTFACLAMSRRYSEETHGAFDITVGRLMECYRGAGSFATTPDADRLDDARRSCGMHLFVMSEEGHSIRVLDPVPRIDLGAVGKGYAVDRAVELLKEWGVRNALVHGGASSAAAFGVVGESDGWPVAVREPRYPWDVLRRFILRDRAVSGSGTQKGRHIINPRTGQPASRQAAWVSVASAAESDAVSTACMTMSADEVEQYARNHPEAWIVIIEGGEGTGEVLRFNDTIFGSTA